MSRIWCYRIEVNDIDGFIRIPLPLIVLKKFDDAE